MNQSLHSTSIKKEYESNSLCDKQVQFILPDLPNQPTSTKLVEEKYVDNLLCDEEVLSFLNDVENQSISTNSQETVRDDLPYSLKFERDNSDERVYESVFGWEVNVLGEESVMHENIEPEVTGIDNESGSDLCAVDIVEKREQCETSTSGVGGGTDDSDRPAMLCLSVGKKLSSESYAESHRSGLVEEEKEVETTESATYWCNECGKPFRHLRLLAEHGRAVHAGLKSHLCYECGNVYKRPVAITVHRLRRQQHGSRAPNGFQCKTCLYWFSRAGNLKVHLNVKH